MRNILCNVLILLASSSVLQTQEVPSGQLALLDSLLQANAYPAEWTDNELAGLGFELLLEASSEAQFVVLGEQHLTHEIPLFTTALFRALHAHHGFNYVALEEGPGLTRALSTYPNRGIRARVADYIHRFPNSVHMLSESEVEMFADIGKISSAAVDPLWGVNQAFGAAHILERLLRLAPNSAAERATQALLEQALEYERERFSKNVSYLTDVAKVSDFETLQVAFQATENQETEFLITTLALSHRISAPYASGANPAFGAFFKSGQLREENMKSLFSDRYREAQAAGDTLPKVLVKSGNVHVRRGLTPRSQLNTFGSFLGELAHFNGRGALFISAHIYNDSSVYSIPKNSWFRPIADAAVEDAWTVFDLRPLQPWIRSRRLGDLPDELSELLRGFDALLIIGGGEQSAVDAFRTPNFNWFPGGS